MHSSVCRQVYSVFAARAHKDLYTGTLHPLLSVARQQHWQHAIILRHLLYTVKLISRDSTL